MLAPNLVQIVVLALVASHLALEPAATPIRNEDADVEARAVVRPSVKLAPSLMVPSSAPVASSAAPFAMSSSHPKKKHPKHPKEKGHHHHHSLSASAHKVMPTRRIGIPTMAFHTPSIVSIGFSALSQPIPSSSVKPLTSIPSIPVLPKSQAVPTASAGGTSSPSQAGKSSTPSSASILPSLNNRAIVRPSAGIRTRSIVTSVPGPTKVSSVHHANPSSRGPVHFSAPLPSGSAAHRPTKVSTHRIIHTPSLHSVRLPSSDGGVHRTVKPSAQAPASTSRPRPREDMQERDILESEIYPVRGLDDGDENRGSFGSFEERDLDLPLDST